MKRHIINDGFDFKEVYCDYVEKKQFNNEEEFNTFVKMHPSCCFNFKKINNDDSVTVYFNVYYHKAHNGQFIIEKPSYNFNPQDENNLQKFYKLVERENQLKADLEFIEKSRKMYEV